MTNTIYDDKPTYYFDTIRKDLLDLIPQKCKNGTLLEVGAGKANTLIYAKNHHYASRVYGIDICALENTYQSDAAIDQFIIGNIEETELKFKQNFFDIILCGDVLEHLIDPWSVIDKLKYFLSEEGVIIASIPNIREWTTIKKILFEGNFQYEAVGILDKTHLRFFCKKNIENLFISNGMTIEHITSNINYTGYKRKLLNNLSFKIFEEFLTTQYYVVAKKQHNNFSSHKASDYENH